MSQVFFLVDHQDGKVAKSAGELATFAKSIGLICPMDSATHQANGAAYLDSHLQSVVSHYTRTSDVEISAIGVGLDLGCFYPKRIAVDLQSDFNETLLLDIARMMASQKLRGQSWKALTTRA